MELWTEKLRHELDKGIEMADQNKKKGQQGVPLFSRLKDKSIKPSFTKSVRDLIK